MKKKISLSTIILALIFLAGIIVLLYPTVSSWQNSRIQSQVITEYDAVIAQLSQEDYDSEFAKADAYNKALNELSFPLIDYEQVEGYEDILNVTGNGVIGYLSIPAIKAELPIYHTTSDSVLNVAIGHMEGTSLPVGGESTHCVLSGHRGLPSAKLFTNLDKLVEGDTFTITVLDRLLTYEIDQVITVEPEELDYLAVVDGEDYVTLMTCTPYGVNTHRLLVRGRRIANVSVEENEPDVVEVDTENEATTVDNTYSTYMENSAVILFGIAMLLFVAFVILMIALLVKHWKMRKNAENITENQEEDKEHE